MAGAQSTGEEASGVQFAQAARHVLYLKPVQTGFPEDSDTAFVVQAASRLLRGNAVPTTFALQEPGRQWSTTCATWHDQAGCYTTRPAAIAAECPSPPGSPAPRGDPFPLSGRPSLAAAGGRFWATGSAARAALPPATNRGSPSGSTSIASTSSRTFSEDLQLTAPEMEEESGSTYSSLVGCTLWAWKEAVSPHLAAAAEGNAVTDGDFLQGVKQALGAHFGELPEEGRLSGSAGAGQSSSWWALVETAGGVASPGPSGSLQSDIYRPLRLPGLLVGDGRLGGISATIAAYESLLLRGFDVEAVALIGTSLGNEGAISSYLGNRCPVITLPPLPLDLPASPRGDPHPAVLAWLAESAQQFRRLWSTLETAHARRLARLREMPQRAAGLFWWPFTQHELVDPRHVAVLDSRCGERFSVFNAGKEGASEAAMEERFDACASWWTQGPDANLQPEVARAVGYAAGRYGHLMFAENASEPTLRCAELLLERVGGGWASRVFFSDNGSTAIEVALKMAFRLFCKDLAARAGDQVPAGGGALELQVLALAGSYHGDTLGAQDAQAPSPFTGFLQQPWYEPRGKFLAPPTVGCKRGRWQVHVPSSYCEQGSPAAGSIDFPSRDAIFGSERDGTRLAEVYRACVEEELRGVGERGGPMVAALILEPVLHGAGGMEMIDPLFQRVLVRACKAEGIPVIFDEVFAGCWRLGVPSAAELLGCTPDIACYAKLLTAGAVPMAATLASSRVFDAFRGPSKLDALLHGHSYSGHPIGCSAAVLALERFGDERCNPNVIKGTRRLQELWDPALVEELSCLRGVTRVVALGTVLAVELEASPSSSGYASMAATHVVHKLRDEGVQARPLGNVVYLMASPLTPPLQCSLLAHKLSAVLNQQ